MKVRARGKATHHDFSTAMGASAQASRSMSLQPGYGRQAGGSELRKDRLGNEDQMAAAKHEQKSELEALMPVTLRCLSAVSGVAEEILLKLLKDATVRSYRQKETVLQPGEAEQYIFLVLDGVVTLHTYTENGRQIINDYLGRGFFFGEVALTDPDNMDFWANSKGGCTIAAIAREHFIEVGMSDPSLFHVLTDQLIKRLRAADHKARDLAFLDVSGRVANALRELAKGPCAITHPDGMQIRMTRQEIGLIVGCSREMVGRAIKMLADQGDIEVNGKNIVVRGAR